MVSHKTPSRPLISIHAPHARSDAGRLSPNGNRGYFNPRSSCEERQMANLLAAAASQFQSTLLMRGATSGQRGMKIPPTYFNPRSSCEERHIF